MNKTKRNILAIAGVFSAVFGVVGVVTSFLQENFLIVVGSALLMVAGLVLLAMAFGE